MAEIVPFWTVQPCTVPAEVRRTTASAASVSMPLPETVSPSVSLRRMTSTRPDPVTVTTARFPPAGSSTATVSGFASPLFSGTRTTRNLGSTAVVEASRRGWP
jgi:hypothetical protein